MKKIKLISAISLACVGSIALASPNCTLDNSSTGWTGSISFHCDEEVNLLDNPIYFEVSNGVIYQAWGAPGFPLVKQRDNLVEMQVKSLHCPSKPYILKANQQFTTSFSSSKSNYEISNFQVGKQARGMLQINLPSKPSFIISQSLPKVDILQNGVKIMEISDAKWGKSKIVTLDVAKAGSEFVVLVDTIDGAKGIASQSKVKLEKNQKQEINIQYQKQAANVGMMRVSPVAPAGVTKEPAYKLINTEGEVVAHGYLNLYKATDIKNIPASEDEGSYKGTTYKLVVDSFTEKGYEYTAKSISTINISKFNIVDVNIEFAKKELPAEVVNVEVEGLPKNAEATLTIQSRTDASKKQEIAINSNKGYTLEISKDKDEYEVVVSDIDYYRSSISPANVFVANEANKSFKISYKYIYPEVKRQVIYYGEAPYLPSDEGEDSVTGISWVRFLKDLVVYRCPDHYGIVDNIKESFSGERLVYRRSDDEHFTSLMLWADSSTNFKGTKYSTDSRYKTQVNYFNTKNTAGKGTAGEFRVSCVPAEYAQGWVQEG